MIALIILLYPAPGIILVLRSAPDVSRTIVDEDGFVWTAGFLIASMVVIVTWPIVVYRAARNGR